MAFLHWCCTVLFTLWFACFLPRLLSQTAGDEIRAEAPFMPHLQIDLAADGSLHNCHGGTKKNPITVSIKDSALRVRWRRHIRLFWYINYGNSIMDTSKNLCLVMCQSENCIIFQPFSIYPSFLPSYSSLFLPFFSLTPLSRSLLALFFCYFLLAKLPRINGFPYSLNENNKHLTFILNVSASNGDIESDSFEIWMMRDEIKESNGTEAIHVISAIWDAFLEAKITLSPSQLWLFSTRLNPTTECSPLMKRVKWFSVSDIIQISKNHCHFLMTIFLH